MSQSIFNENKEVNRNLYSAGKVKICMPSQAKKS